MTVRVCIKADTLWIPNASAAPAKERGNVRAQTFEQDRAIRQIRCAAFPGMDARTVAIVSTFPDEGSSQIALALVEANREFGVPTQLVSLLNTPASMAGVDLREILLNARAENNSVVMDAGSLREDLRLLDLADLVDYVLLTVESGRCTAEDIRGSVNFLMQAGLKVSGVALSRTGGKDGRL